MKVDEVSGEKFGFSRAAHAYLAGMDSCMLMWEARSLKSGHLKGGC